MHIYLLLATSILLTGLTAVLISMGAARKAENTQSLLRSYIVIESVTKLWSDLQDAESGQRGYLLTGDFSHLENYNNSLWEIDLELSRLTRLTGDNPEQKRLIIEKLSPLIGTKRNELELSIMQYQRSGSEAALVIMRSDQGRVTFDELKSVVQQIKMVETELQNERAERLENVNFKYKLISFTGLLIIALTMIVATINLRRKNIENRKLMAHEVENNKRLIRLNEKEVKLRMDISKFMGNAAHDLRNPLNAIKSVNELLKMDPDGLNEEQLEYLNYISESTTQMAALINNLLEVNKFEEGTVVITTEPVDIHSAIKTLLFGHETSTDKKQLKVKIESDFEGRTVVTDKGIFIQVADNLISNAIKYSPPGKKIKIALKESGNRFRLIVVDEGQGIPKSEIPKLYRRYQTLSTRPTGGEKATGLGLSIVKDLVDLIGASIEVDSQEGVGTTFVVEFPYFETGQNEGTEINIEHEQV